jgi:hypothetical protein
MKTVKDLFPDVTVLHEEEPEVLMLSSEGAAKYTTGYRIECHFKFPMEELMKYVEIVAQVIERDDVTLAAKGFIAGHVGEFQGTLTVLEKRHG